MIENIPEFSRAHAGFGFVEQPQKRAIALAIADGFDKLQISPCGRVDLHIVGVFDKVHPLYAANLALLRFGQIFKQRSASENRLFFVFDFIDSLIVFAKLLFQIAVGALQPERPVVIYLRLWQ